LSRVRLQLIESCSFGTWEDHNTRISYFLVIFIIVAVLYGVIPIAGAFFNRYKWGRFRKRFDNLRLAPLLDYRQYRQIGNAASGEGQGGIFRFAGEIESITDGKTLWVKGSDLTISVSLEKTNCWLLPIHEGGGVPDAPEQIHWNRISTLTEGARVFIGGSLKMQNNRFIFVSSKEKPLIVIFYSCPDSSLTDRIIRAARTRNEYWNNITPVSLAMGALALVYIAASFLNRPAFRMTVITALVAIFTPILPVFPPGFLFTVLYRRMTWDARKYRAYWDLALLPMRFLSPGQESCILNTGEKYGFLKYDSLPPEAAQENIPFLIPEHAKEGKKAQWHIFGVINEGAKLPVKSTDPHVSFGILHDNPVNIARRYAIKAYILEVFAWLVLFLGIGINIVFIFLILFLLKGISF